MIGPFSFILAVITREFRIFNYIEAGLWTVVAVIVLAMSRRLAGAARTDARIGAIDLVLFGASDLVEAQTGAWWRPWWLLVWKGICLLVMLVLAIQWFRKRHA